MFYTSAHIGILYDMDSNLQRQLLGHTNAITSTAVSRDDRYLITGDAGEDSLIIVWDLKPQRENHNYGGEIYINETLPIKTLFNPHGTGIFSAEFTPDSKYLISLGAGTLLMMQIPLKVYASGIGLQLPKSQFLHS